jgi:DNA mismatch repair protein MutL
VGIIRELPQSVVNQIAAGEVVERPASVVKELLENAIDAGATRVELGVERGGKDLVRVVDNGKGIDPDDIPRAFLPHATSKLGDAEDLFRIRTLGFRGEALAAIAEVSRVTCTTRTPDSPTGWTLAIDAGKPAPLRESAAAIGTIMEVRNLFHAIPVRRSFLKSDSTEAAHVDEMFVRVALAHEGIHMTLRSGGRVVYDMPASAGFRERVGVAFGRELADGLLWVEGKVEGVHIRGYVGHPSQSRSNTKAQFLFVGGRFVRDRSLGHALSEAYRGLLMVGRQPVAFLHIDIPPDQVDVNVHPTKIEVRFREPGLIYSHLLNTIRRTFLQSELHSKLQAPPSSAVGVGATATTVAAVPAVPAPKPDFDEFGPAAAEDAEGRRRVNDWFDSPRVAAAAALPQQSFSLREPVSPTHQAAIPFADPVPDFRSSSDEVAEEEGGDFGEEAAVAGAGAASPAREVPEPATWPSRALQVHDSYLVAETEDGMVVIDQHALHERILFEELKLRVDAGGVEAQRLLVPEPVDLTPTEAASVIERREVLSRLGLELEPLSGGTVMITSIPAMLRNVPADRLVRDLAEHLRSKPNLPSADHILVDVLNMIACKAAVKAGQRLAPEEIEALLARRHLVQNSHHCPHGRPTALVFTKAELEKQFGRLG